MRAIFAAAISIAVSFTTVIGLGFLIRRQTTVSDTAFGTAAGIAIGVIACAIYFAILKISPWKRTRRITLPPPPAAEPPCAHLLPIEQALRAADFKIRLRDGRVAMAECRVNEPELARLFPATCYREGFYPERSPWDNPYAGIYCAQCPPSSHIFVLHPLESNDRTPWFPSPPV